MLITPKSMSTGTISQLCSERSKFNPEDLEPLKLCLKFNPSSIALYYKLSQFQNEKFLHHIDIEKEIESNMTAEEIYNRLIIIEPIYWNPNKISKAQIKRLIIKLMEKNDRIRQTDMDTNESSGMGKLSQMTKMVSISSSAFCAPELIVNAESIIINEPEPDLNEKNEPKGEVDVEKNQTQETNSEQHNLTKESATQKEEIGLKKVYIDELRKNTYADKARSYLGQAKIEDDS